LAKRLTEKQKNEIAENFKNGKTIEALSEDFNCTILTITRNLKKNLGEIIFKELAKKNKISDQFKNAETFDVNKSENSNFSSEEFIEISPLHFDLENFPRKELSSIPLQEVDFPKIVYMIVDKNIELEIKLLKDYPEWEFLPNEDLKRKTIEIYFDLKLAKRACSKEHKVIKVPNTDVFRIVSPILISRGISRIVSADKLIAL
jgi:hypothetical protein